jgi:hypothetical protein
MVNRNPWKTPDEVVATNLYNLRTDAANKGANSISRRKLADLLDENTGKEWPVQRIIDIEGKRSRTRAPSPAAWSEIVALALALGVNVYDLVLPSEHQDVITAKSRSKVEVSKLPDGGPKTKTVLYVRHSSRDEYAKLLFGLPGDSLTPNNIKRLAAQFNIDIGDAMLDIQSMQAGLDRTLETLDRMREEEEVD